MSQTEKSGESSAGSGAADVNVKVVCRFRPENKLEQTQKGSGSAAVSIDGTQVVCPTVTDTKFVFDAVFASGSKQREVFETIARPIVASILEGFNCTVFAYGQTGSGKTHTMMGVVNPSRVSTPDDERGLIPRLLESTFDAMSAGSSGVEWTVRVSYIEIYMEKIRDLLYPVNDNLKIRDSAGAAGSSGSRGVYIEDVTERYVSSYEETLSIMAEGQTNRSIAATRMNDESSRSHSVCLVTITQVAAATGSKKSAKLFLVDLAGSEKIVKTGAAGQTLEEAKHINKSLSALGNVINALTEANPHVPYRDSKLTRLLSDSLGGNSKTLLIITASPAIYNVEETVSTLRFGSRAKRIKNKPTVNAEKSVAEYKLIVAALEKRIARQEEIIRAFERDLSKLRGGDTSTAKPAPAPTATPPATATTTAAPATKTTAPVAAIKSAAAVKPGSGATKRPASAAATKAGAAAGTGSRPPSITVNRPQTGAGVPASPTSATSPSSQLQQPSTPTPLQHPPSTPTSITAIAESPAAAAVASASAAAPLTPLSLTLASSSAAAAASASASAAAIVKRLQLEVDELTAKSESQRTENDELRDRCAERDAEYELLQSKWNAINETALADSKRIRAFEETARTTNEQLSTAELARKRAALQEKEYLLRIEQLTAQNADLTKQTAAPAPAPAPAAQPPASPAPANATAANDSKVDMTPIGDAVAGPRGSIAPPIPPRNGKPAIKVTPNSPLSIASPTAASGATSPAGASPAPMTKMDSKKRLSGIGTLIYSAPPAGWNQREWELKLENERLVHDLKRKIEEHLELTLAIEEMKNDRAAATATAAGTGTPKSKAGSTAPAMTTLADLGSAALSSSASDAERAKQIAWLKTNKSVTVTAEQLQLMNAQNEIDKLKRQSGVLSNNADYLKKLLVTRSEHIVFLESALQESNATHRRQWDKFNEQIHALSTKLDAANTTIATLSSYANATPRAGGGGSEFRFGTISYQPGTNNVFRNAADGGSPQQSQPLPLSTPVRKASNIAVPVTVTRKAPQPPASAPPPSAAVNPPPVSAAAAAAERGKQAFLYI